mmetsp:Transcript_8157/g.18270  ORF Transcript_8157/g.18270 Transcript_8157/m.18270 type:complete len:210 (-) Transcript_8157:1891-2520(-)
MRRPWRSNQDTKLSRKPSTSPWENIVSLTAWLSRSRTLTSSRLNWIRRSCTKIQKLKPSPFSPTSTTPKVLAVSRAFSRSASNRFRSSAVARAGRPNRSNRGPKCLMSSTPLPDESSSVNVIRKESSSVLLNPAHRRCSFAFTARLSSTHCRNCPNEIESPASSRVLLACTCSDWRRPEALALIFDNDIDSPETPMAAIASGNLALDKS